MAYNKITTGFVVQEYDDNGNPVGQHFVAGDQVDYENEEGENITPPANENYLPFDMVQPQ